MDLIGEKLTSNAALYKVMCVCLGHGPKETCTEGLTYKGSSRSMVTTEASMDFSQEMPSFSFKDSSLKDSGSTFLVELSIVDASRLLMTRRV